MLDLPLPETKRIDFLSGKVICSYRFAPPPVATGN